MHQHLVYAFFELKLYYALPLSIGIACMRAKRRTHPACVEQHTHIYRLWKPAPWRDFSSGHLSKHTAAALRQFVHQCQSYETGMITKGIFIYFT